MAGRTVLVTGVTANALHPGVVHTSFGAEDPGGIQRMPGFAIVLRFLKTPGQGAVTLIKLASSADLEHVSGQYFANSKPRRSSKHGYDRAVAGQLW